MTRTPLLVALVAMLVAAPMAVAALPGATQSPTADGADAAPGERLSGAVAASEAELDGEVQERTLGVRLARANSTDAKAGVVADEVAATRERVERLQQRKQRLLEARRNGSISRAEFRTKMAELAARSGTVERLANRTGRVAAGLPSEALAERGVDADAISQLRRNAANLSGPEVARIARQVAGRDVGKSMGGKPDDLPGAANRSGGRGNGSDRGAGGGNGNGSDRGAGGDRGNASDGTAANASTPTVDHGAPDVRPER